MGTAVLPSKIGRGLPYTWAPYLRNRWEVRNSTGSLQGTKGGTSFGGCHPSFTQACLSDEGRDWPRQLSDARYVVWSYHTPIAWLTIDDEWIVPDIRYSMTTSQHQSLVRSALCTDFTADWDSVSTAPSRPYEDIAERAKKSLATGERVLAEYDAVGLPIAEGPYAWRNYPTG